MRHVGLFLFVALFGLLIAAPIIGQAPTAPAAPAITKTAPPAACLDCVVPNAMYVPTSVPTAASCSGAASYSAASGCSGARHGLFSRMKARRASRRAAGCGG